MTVSMINSFLASLSENPQFGLGIMYPAPGIIERIGPDWDWIWIDGQHGNLDYHDIMAAVRACSLIQRPAVVRVPGNDAGIIGKTLDTAAECVMVPMIDNADQARGAVQASKFAALGARSFGGRRPTDLDGRAYANRDTAQPLLICQIETAEGLKNVNFIAGVEGVDIVFFSTDDIRLEAGLPMDKQPPDGFFSDAMHKIAEASKSNNKIAGGVFTTPDAIKEAVKIGYRLICVTADVVFLATGSKKKAQEIRQCLVNLQEPS